MGPPAPSVPRQKTRSQAKPGTIVYSMARGSNVVDVDGNRFVDLAAGFGAQILGHAHPAIRRVLELQASRLLQALGEVHPADATIALCEKLATVVYPAPGARVLLGQSGADAITAALKTAVLATGRPGVLAFEGSYHGLSFAPLAASGLRPSYREPFRQQLNPHVWFLDYPADAARASACLERARETLRSGTVGAVLLEPILGRGGCIVPPTGFIAQLADVARSAGAVLILDEVWTGLGRSGHWLYSASEGVVPDLVCLGKGLGGGVPISACLGAEEVMKAWERSGDVVHTSTFAGAPLACAASIATLDTLRRERLVERSAEVGSRWMKALRDRLAGAIGVREVRGSGLMIGIELSLGSGAAAKLQRLLLERGYLVSTGGGARQTLVLTPALTIDERLLGSFEEPLVDALRSL